MEYVGLRSQTIIFEKYKDKKWNNSNKKNNNLIANNAHTNLKEKKIIFVQNLCKHGLPIWNKVFYFDKSSF